MCEEALVVEDVNLNENHDFSKGGGKVSSAYFLIPISSRSNSGLDPRGRQEPGVEQRYVLRADFASLTLRLLPLSLPASAHKSDQFQLIGLDRNATLSLSHEVGDKWEREFQRHQKPQNALAKYVLL